MSESETNPWLRTEWAAAKPFSMDDMRAWIEEIKKPPRPTRMVGFCSLREVQAAEREGREPIPYCYETVEIEEKP